MKGVQYTIRGVPEEVDAALRKEAAESGKSLNAIIIGKLAEESDVPLPRKTNGLERFAGTWVDDPGFDEAMEGHEIVHAEEWE